jgi:hypothetical protein
VCCKVSLSAGNHTAASPSGTIDDNPSTTPMNRSFRSAQREWDREQLKGNIDNGTVRDGVALSEASCSPVSSSTSGDPALDSDLFSFRFGIVLPNGRQPQRHC